MTYLSHIATRTVERQQLHTFPGAIDTKGRQLGCLITLLRVVHAPGPDVRTYTDRDETWTAESGYNDIEPGEYFGWIGGAMRGVDSYGPVQPMHWCKTEAER